jgi:hypothetical protein
MSSWARQHGQAHVGQDQFASHSVQHPSSQWSSLARGSQCRTCNISASLILIPLLQTPSPGPCKLLRAEPCPDSVELAASVIRCKMPRRTSSTSTASPDASPSSSSSPFAVASVDPEPPRPKTHRRRGHFKSRLGCFNCKRRRIKCNEDRPDCSACRRLSLECAYPPQNAVAAAGPPGASLSILTLQDLALFHRFLTAGIPAIPLRCEHLWWEVATISHNVSIALLAVQFGR